MARAAAGDASAAKGLTAVGEWIGIGVANLVHIFNPDVVVFGGAMRDLLPVVRQQVEDVLTSSLPAPGEHVILSAPALGDDSTLLGAAESAFAPLLDDPMGALATSGRVPRPRTATVSV